MNLRTDTTAWELTTQRLQLRVAKPGFLYRRTRFDWTGIVTDIRLDDTHTFCSVESPDPLQGAGGLGLLGEFGIHEPVGYEDAAIGDTFPKFGVGLLQKPDDSAYFFMRDYPAEPFPCSVTLLDNGIRFEQDPIDCRGFAARLTKTLTVAENTLRIAYRMENTGSRQINTTEYNHNFLLIDETPTGSAYTLRFSTPMTFTRNDQSIWSTDGTLTWPDGIPGFYATCGEVPPVSGLHWTLTNQKTGASVTERVDFHPARIACWGMPHVISPEVFHPVSLAPGASASWTREWTFHAV